MKGIRMILALLAVLLAATAVWLTVQFRGQLPVLLAAPAEARLRAEKTMEALCTGAYSEAEALLFGVPDLGAEVQPDSRVNQLIWEGYRDSLDYELVGPLYATEQGLAQDVKIISMELPAVVEHLGQRSQDLLQQRVAEAQDVSEVYSADNTYREALVMEVLEEAARQALEEDVRYTYQIVSLQLVCREGQWWVLPEKTLLNAVFGNVAG